METTPQKMVEWCRTLLNANTQAPKKSLQEYLASIPRLESLSDIPKGTPVLVRGDVDAKPGPKIGDGDERLSSMVETLKFGIARGWKQVIFGHIGRKPEGSLAAVARRIGELVNQEAPLITDWWDAASQTIPDKIKQTIAAAKPGSLIVLDNTRRHEIERVLWDAARDDLPALAPKLANFANQFAAKVANVYVNEALSAGSLDSSTTIVPAAMDRVALGNYVAAEFDGPMQECLRATLVVFSGLKIDKLDDLQAMIDRGTVRWVFVAGSLAMALRKASAELEGRKFSLGVAENPANAKEPWYIPPERVDQAKKMIAEGRKKGIQFVLPVDSVLQDGRVAETLGPGDQQFDVGPQTSELFEKKLNEFLDSVRSQLSTSKSPVVFYNGVFGMFEDARFEEGTRRFIPQLKRLKDAGVAVYIGGGEGGKALEKYGRPDWVTHCFTAGGTVLNALGSLPVPYLQALSMAAKK
jgi:phosphoglycerate kinase